MHALLREWETFYVIVGSSAAALTGLQFVVVALMAEAIELAGGEQEMRAFGTPTVVYFCGVLLIAALCSTPGHTAASLALCLLLIGIAGAIYVTFVTIQARSQTGYQPVFEDWLFHSILPAVSFVALLIAGCVGFAHAPTALYIIAASSLLLLYIGIHNAWDTALWISTARRERHRQNKG